MIQGIISILPQLVTAAITLITALMGALINALPQLLSAGIQLIQALINGVLSLLGTLLSSRNINLTNDHEDWFLFWSTVSFGRTVS